MQGCIEYVPIECIQNRKGVLLCVQDKCTSNPFLCINKYCKCQTATHKQCLKLDLDYFIDEVMKKKLMDMPNQIKKSFEAARQIYQSVIQKLTNDLKELQRKMRVYGLHENEFKFYNYIVSSNSQRKNIVIDGHLMSKMREEILKKQTRQKQSYLVEEEINNYWKFQRQQFDQFRQSIKLLTISNNPMVLKSKIVNNGLLIKQFLEGKVKRFNLLYRASENNFDANTFHLLCDNIPNTVTIVKTQFGKIIGGYTPLCWNDNAQNKFFVDATKKSFLFSITNQQKYPIITANGEKAIKYSNQYGPIFGGGHDLLVANKANSNNESYANFPTSYNNGKSNKNQQSFKLFGGSSEGYYFKIREWQVFEVVFIPKKYQIKQKIVYKSSCTII